MTDQHDKLTGSYFGSWALEGRGHRMAEGHRPLVDAIVEQGSWEGKKVLDIGCGVGEALISLKEVGASAFAGIDLSDEMIKLASERLPEGDFQVGTAANLPWKDGQFDEVISVEAMYYFKDLEAGLNELFRVLKSGGHFASAIELYGENIAAKAWMEALPMEVHCLSEQEWKAVFEKTGFRNVRTSRVVRQTPKPESEFEPSKFFPGYTEYLEYVKQGALLVVGEKP